MWNGANFMVIPQMGCLGWWKESWIRRSPPGSDTVYHSDSGQVVFSSGNQFPPFSNEGIAQANTYASFSLDLRRCSREKEFLDYKSVQIGLTHLPLGGFEGYRFEITKTHY